MKKTLGGDRLGAGNRMEVDLHGYNRSTHNLGYIMRTTMSPGTLVPFLVEVALPDDTMDINLECDVKTHPTVGPLFGSFKVQLDIFLCPVRLYQGQLHNNKLKIGLDMASVKLPQLKLTGTVPTVDTPDIDNFQINPSCILAYLGIRGVGIPNAAAADKTRLFNAVPLLAYWDIYKNYYANKQEGEGVVIHTTRAAVNQTINDITIDGIILPQAPGTGAIDVGWVAPIIIAYNPPNAPNPGDVLLTNSLGQTRPANVWFENLVDNGTGNITGTFDYLHWGRTVFTSWDYINATTPADLVPGLTRFPLDNIDAMREQILANVLNPNAYIIDGAIQAPYGLVVGQTGGFNAMLSSQEGLGVKTYQSDLLNNWLEKDWISGPTGINEITAIDTSGGSFTLDTLMLARKVYDMLNRIAVSGGSYADWMEANWGSRGRWQASNPMYMGGLIKELVFQEVVSNSQSDQQPLGTLAGKGVMAKKHKGGRVRVKVEEISYVIGLVSLTPRIDYSQGNRWDTHLQTMDDFHKPALDQTGFQDLSTEQMAFWDTIQTGGGDWITHSAGKQPAWVNYMTNYNRTFGNFAVKDNEMFMTLNRRYEPVDYQGRINDITTYIDPVKYNFIFADTALDAQNFWVQIAVDNTARRKMSAKIMPNL